VSRPAKMAEVYTRNTPEGGTTMLDRIAGKTPIGGSPSLDEIFKDKGANNVFNISPVEAHRQMQNKIDRRKP
jgi:hypothetical protein